MKFFLLIYIIGVIFCIVKTNKKIFINEIFWLLVWWILIIGIYFTANVKWKYSMSIFTAFFIAYCFVILVLARKYGMKSNVKIFSVKPNTTVLKMSIFLGLFGDFLFIIDYLRLNGINSSLKSSYDISLIGGIGSIFVPILLVNGLYYLAKDIKENKKISIMPICLLGAYTIPCILNNGRESLLYVIIGVISIYGYTCNFDDVKKIDYQKTLKNLLLFFLILIIMNFILKISQDRFGENEISTYLNTHNVSPDTITEAKKWGKLEFLYYNFISYFGHQIPFLEFVLKEYDGPYMFGMYEFNIISRRLPSFLDLDYRSVGLKLKYLYSANGESFSGCWQTVLGSFVFEFGKFGVPVICLILGVALGKINKKYYETYDLRYAVLKSLICLSMFSTIQLGPFYNILVYGAFIWWVVIFKNGYEKIE